MLNNVAGEDLTDTYIVAKGRAICLQIPTLEFLLRSPLRTILLEMTSNVSEIIPSNQQIFNKFKTEQKWNKYKQDILQEIYDKNRLKRNFCHGYAQVLRDL